MFYNVYLVGPFATGNIIMNILKYKSSIRISSWLLVAVEITTTEYY